MGINIYSMSYFTMFQQCESPCSKKIIVRILDEHGKPTAARIRVTGHESVYYAPEGHRVDFPITELEGDIGRGEMLCLTMTGDLHMWRKFSG